MTRWEWKQSLHVALETLATQKTRAFLTMLGVVIGVASVISVAAIIQGLNQHITDKVRSIGSQSFFFTRFPAFTFDFDHLPQEIRVRKHFVPEDAEAIRENCPAVNKAVPILTRAAFLGGSNEIRFQDNHVEEPILRGAGPELMDVLPIYAIAQGRFLTESENLHAAQVCVLGAAISDALFGALDPIGRDVRVNGIPFQVIGILEPNQGLFGGPGADQFILIPYRTFHKTYPEIKEVVLAISVRDPSLMSLGQDQAVEVMRRRRHVPPSQPNDFEITSPDLITDLWKQLTSAIVALTLIIASIGLLVGGIGVMNIMLISVTERTKEIGIRKAVGARGRDILAQFLLEAMMLTSVGGLIGIAAGIVLSVSVAYFIPSLPAKVSLFWTLMGLVISLSVGLFFGIYPAVKASNLDPVRCLHYE
jgi:putative ABC transport system permease protein